MSGYLSKYEAGVARIEIREAIIETMKTYNPIQTFIQSLSLSFYLFGISSASSFLLLFMHVKDIFVSIFERVLVINDWLIEIKSWIYLVYSFILSSFSSIVTTFLERTFISNHLLSSSSSHEKKLNVLQFENNKRKWDESCINSSLISSFFVFRLSKRTPSYSAWLVLSILVDFILNIYLLRKCKYIIQAASIRWPLLIHL